MSPGPADAPPGGAGRVASLFVLVVVAFGLFLLGYVAFPSFRP